MLDLIIVGGGIAGQVLAAQAYTAGLKFLLFDQSNPRSASRMAAGVINPITGRSMSKSWMIDELLPKADQFYRSWEQTLSRPLYRNIETLRLLPDIKAENDWAGKQGSPEYAPYLSDHQIHPSPNGFIEGKWFKIREGRMLNINQWLDSFLAFLTSRDLLRKEQFNPGLLREGEGFWEYQTFKAGKVIFCEGPKLVENPIFDYLPMVPNRGQWRKIHIPNFDTQHITHISGLNLNPYFETNQFYLGSTYERNETKAEATENGDKRLQGRLAEYFLKEFTLLGRFAGIRPTVPDRKPLIGAHPDRAGLYVFNGMGSKGVSLSPYFAEALLKHLEMGMSIPDLVDIKRYESHYGN